VVSSAGARQETLSEKVQRVVREDIAVVPYDAGWPESFRRERDHLRAILPADLLGRIEHFGSTAVPGLAAKPVIDMLIEVTDLAATRERIVPILEAEGYDYFWRPSWGDDVPPYYAWFIRRAADGHRTHHLHMVEAHFEHWRRLLFRDYLIAHPEAAAAYGALKHRLAAEHPNDRVAYTQGKTAFVLEIMARIAAQEGMPGPA